MRYEKTRGRAKNLQKIAKWTRKNTVPGEGDGMGSQAAPSLPAGEDSAGGESLSGVSVGSVRMEK